MVHPGQQEECAHPEAGPAAAAVSLGFKSPAAPTGPPPLPPHPACSGLPQGTGAELPLVRVTSTLLSPFLKDLFAEILLSHFISILSNLKAYTSFF